MYTWDHTIKHFCHIQLWLCSVNENQTLELNAYLFHAATKLSLKSFAKIYIHQCQETNFQYLSAALHLLHCDEQSGLAVWASSRSYGADHLFMSIVNLWMWKYKNKKNLLSAIFWISFTLSFISNKVSLKTLIRTCRFQKNQFIQLIQWYHWIESLL